jgi:hypothetical protein
MLRLQNTLAIGLLSTVLIHTAAFGTLLITEVGSGNIRTDATLGVGYQFRVSSDTLVKALGFWDQYGDGLAASHTVVIWRVTDQANIAQVTVSSGTAAPLEASFRWANLTSDVTLSTGTDYRIISYGYELGDSYRDHDQTDTFSSILQRVSLTSPKAYFTNTPPSPAFPISTGSWGDGREYVGPNLSTAIIPEPATMTLLMLGGMALWRRRKNTTV